MLQRTLYSSEKLENSSVSMSIVVFPEVHLCSALSNDLWKLFN